MGENKVLCFPEKPNSDRNEFEFSCITPQYMTISPADQLFVNGRLKPHSFLPAGESRKPTKESVSLMSSRSNSSKSSATTSSCSSARTSASDASERKAFKKKIAAGGSFTAEAQRWQFITPAPRRRRRRLVIDKKEDRNGFFERVLRSFVRSCRACHAMEGAVLDSENLPTYYSRR